jgi:hypothetical protein
LGGGSLAGNTVVGNGAMAATATGGSNSAFGWQTLAGVTSGANNTAYGYSSAKAITTATNVTSVGAQAGALITTGGGWTVLGSLAGRYKVGTTDALTATTNSLFVGSSTKGTESAINEIVVGTAAEGKGSNTAVWGNTSITNHYMAGSINMVTNDSYVYLRGDATTDGSVRVSFQSGTTAIEFEKRISGSWVSRHSFAMPD